MYEISDTTRVWIRLLSQPFMHCTNSSARQVVCANGAFPLLQNVWMELECQLDAHVLLVNQLVHIWKISKR
jgi:hypothetical protein